MMNAKRAKFTTLTTKNVTEVVPVLIHDSDGEPQYAYATFASAEEAEAAVASLDQREHEVLASGHEVIIDENGHAMTLQQLVEGNTVEEVEALEEADGTHTILHIVPDDVHEVQEVGEIISAGEEIEGEPDADQSLSPTDIIGRKTFFCSNCGNCYSAAGSLKLHMRACLRQREEVPAEQRKCNVCDKVFNSVSYLKEHMMRHNGEGPRRCTRCYRKFVADDKWKAHMEQHKHQDKLDAEAEALAAQHGGRKVVVKEFTCSFCSENFTVVFEVGQAKRRYACDSCREKYSNAEMLKRHKQMVDDKREFHCERCGRKFVFEGFLQRHLPTCDGTIKRRRDMK